MNVSLFSSERDRLSVIHSCAIYATISLEDAFTKIALSAVERESNMFIACDVHSPRLLRRILISMVRAPTSCTMHKK